MSCLITLLTLLLTRLTTVILQYYKTVKADIQATGYFHAVLTNRLIPSLIF